MKMAEHSNHVLQKKNVDMFTQLRIYGSGKQK
jgi:hypothetical protein